MANNIINLDRKRNRRSRANSARWEKMVFGNPGSCKWFDVSLLYQADALGRKQ